jgi:hypothetical protein
MGLHSTPFEWQHSLGAALRAQQAASFMLLVEATACMLEDD